MIPKLMNVVEMAERLDTKSSIKFGGFRSQLVKRPVCLATLQSCDTIKQSVCGWLYIYIYMVVLGPEKE